MLLYIRFIGEIELYQRYKVWLNMYMAAVTMVCEVMPDRVPVHIIGLASQSSLVG